MEELRVFYAMLDTKNLVYDGAQQGLPEVTWG
jgi:hypothetical protein